MHPMFFKGTVFQIGSFDFFFTLGVIVIITLALTMRVKDFPLSRLEILGMAALIAVMGMIGGKSLYLFLNPPPEMAESPSITQRFGMAGFAFLGVLVFEILAIFIFTRLRRHKVSFLKVGDAGIPLLLLLQAFSRIGCFFNGCCYGTLTNLPWGVASRLATPPGPRHPVQVYSIIFLVFISGSMAIVNFNKKYPEGLALFGSLFLYGFFRFFVEFLRAENVPVFGVISWTQVALAGLALVSAAAIIKILIDAKKTPKTS
jgi:phosphatidylglycerol:prolipoprotein diacylglycerol transferase